jgi:hypothetical protein
MPAAVPIPAPTHTPVNPAAVHPNAPPAAAPSNAPARTNAMGYLPQLGLIGHIDFFWSKVRLEWKKE